MTPVIAITYGTTTGRSYHLGEKGKWTPSDKRAKTIMRNNQKKSRCEIVDGGNKRADAARVSSAPIPLAAYE